MLRASFITFLLVTVVSCRDGTRTSGTVRDGTAEAAPAAPDAPAVTADMLAPDTPADSTGATSACGPGPLRCKLPGEICFALVSDRGTDYSCEAVPQSCQDRRDCACLASMLCAPPRGNCLQRPADNLIQCDKCPHC
jgi:hypothetical protein